MRNALGGKRGMGRVGGHPAPAPHLQNGLWDPGDGGPRPSPNFFKMFMEDGPQDYGANYVSCIYAGGTFSPPRRLHADLPPETRLPLRQVRVCVLTQRYTGMDNATCLELMPSELPAFQTPAAPLGLADVAEGLRDYFKGSEHDAYTNANPDEQWRPIFVLRTSISHITRTRGDLPEGLSVVQYVAMGPPALTPFVPVYQVRRRRRRGVRRRACFQWLQPDCAANAHTPGRPLHYRRPPPMQGLRPEDYPPQLTHFDSSPDPASIFWKARRVQALVMQV